ncbi:hypothetical protein AD951_08880 [Acetobacter malorum]|uniref:Uncharacterized protein n=1 Tax=Acetobacter malorum TaxID=178901 RepID=A0A149ULR1_9PROT|nr:hypothetical protein [Acetobacter malorum]KXV68929.1 hypothetical protein AD951_08880 [Acetobacter malorum]
MTSSEPPTAALIAFPGRVVLSRPDASRYLGIGQNALLVMKLLACGPRSISMDRKTLYREEDLDQFRQTLIGTVGVAQADTPYKKLEPDAAAEAATVDPLMCLLVRHLIKRRMILIFLWSMVLVGGLMSLTLF